MSLRSKFVFVILSVYLLSVVFMLIWAGVLFFGAKADILKSPPQQISDLEFARLQAIVDGKAGDIGNLLDSYYQDVEYVKKYYSIFQKDYSVYDFSRAENVYPEKNNFGLPHYGYISPVYGSYADYDLRGVGSPWLPKRVVEKVKIDKKYRASIAQDLNLLSLFNPAFKMISEKHTKDLDLIWVVLDSGVTNVYPPYNYNSILKDDSSVANLNESEEDYVRLLDPENNPEKKTLWLSPYFDEFRKSWMTSVVAPIYQADKFVGTIGMDILLDSLSNDIVNLSFANNSYVFLIDGSGRPIAFPQKAINEIIDDNNAKLILQEVLKPLSEQKWDENAVKYLSMPINNLVRKEWKDVIDRMVVGERFTKKINTVDGERVVSIASVAGTKWSLGVVVPAEDVFLLSSNLDVLTGTFVDKLWHFSFLIIIVGIIFMVLLSFIAYQNIVAPILDLSDDISRVSLEDNQTMVNDIRRTDEIGMLRKKFNNMILRLREEIKKRKAAEDSLKEKVDILEKSNRLMIGREKKMIELKKQLGKQKIK